MSDACEFGSLDQANETLGFMMRQWNTIASTLFKDEVYVPLLFENEDGMVHGNDWARGFMRGMGMRHDGWAELVNDEEHGGCLIPMMMLCHEHDEDPDMRPEPISHEQREDVIVHMAGEWMDRIPSSTRKHRPKVRLLRFRERTTSSGWFPAARRAGVRRDQSATLPVSRFKAFLRRFGAMQTGFQRAPECDFALFRNTRTRTRSDTCLARIFRYLAVPVSLLSC